MDRLMRYYDPQLPRRGAPQARAHALNLFARHLSIYMARRPGRIDADNQQIDGLKRGFQIPTEFTLMVGVGIKNPRNNIEKRDIVIARECQSGWNRETIDELSCGAKLRPAGALRNIARQHQQVGRMPINVPQ
jgi:hypothetical protein